MTKSLRCSGQKYVVCNKSGACSAVRELAEIFHSRRGVVSITDPVQLANVCTQHLKAIFLSPLQLALTATFFHLPITTITMQSFAHHACLCLCLTSGAVSRMRFKACTMVAANCRSCSCSRQADSAQNTFSPPSKSAKLRTTKLPRRDSSLPPAVPRNLCHVQFTLIAVC